MSGCDLSVVVPCFESGPWIEELAARLDVVLDALGGSSEIVLVHDASGEATWSRIAALARSHPRVRGIDLAERAGQHRAILCGFAHARGRILVTMDDDLEHRPEDVPRLVAALQENPGLQGAIAAFPEERRSALRRAGSVVMDRLYHWRYGGTPGLQMTPFRALTRDLAEQLLAKAGSQPYLPRLLLEATPALANVPVTHQTSRGPSRYSTLDLVRLAWKGLGGPELLGRGGPAGPLYRVRAEVGGEAGAAAGAPPAAGA